MIGYFFFPNQKWLFFFSEIENDRIFFLSCTSNTYFLLINWYVCNALNLWYIVVHYICIYILYIIDNNIVLSVMNVNNYFLHNVIMLVWWSEIFCQGLNIKELVISKNKIYAPSFDCWKNIFRIEKFMKEKNQVLNFSSFVYLNS